MADHAAERFSVHPTRRGDFIVRDGPRDLARFPTRAEADDARGRAQAEATAVGATTRRERTASDAFLSAHPGLGVRQIAWQEWRSGAHTHARAAARYTDSVRRSALNYDAPAYAYLLRAATEAEDHGQGAYRARCALDSATKEAIRTRDAAAWAAALDLCELAMRAEG